MGRPKKSPARIATPTASIERPSQTLTAEQIAVRDGVVGAMLGQAMAAKARAVRSGLGRDVALAYVLDAAFVAERRRERNADDPALDALRLAAVKYLETRGDSEQWSAGEFAPSKGPRRTRAVRALIKDVHVRRNDLKKVPAASQPFCADILADNIVGKAAAIVGRASYRAESAVAVGRKIYQSINGKIADHTVASWALQAVGVSESDANNWTSSAAAPSDAR